jgi:hypothetical protein
MQRAGTGNRRSSESIESASIDLLYVDFHEGRPFAAGRNVVAQSKRPALGGSFVKHFMGEVLLPCMHFNNKTAQPLSVLASAYSHVD